MSLPDRPKILVIDDTPEDIQVVVQFLQADYAIVVATSGEAGLRLAGAQPSPELILLDIRMPGMDGYQVCERLLADERTRDTPIIFITALADEDDEQKGLNLGAVDYVHKPFHPPLVKLRIRNQLELKRHRARLAALVEQRTAELADLNRNLEQRVAQEVEKNIQKDHLMFHQARLAAMGEMLSNIAHQWRQPLNMVALLIQNFQLECSTGLAPDCQACSQLVKDCMQHIRYLSGVIDDFSGFFRPEDSETTFDPFSAVEKTVKLVRNALEHQGIELVLENRGMQESSGYFNEFAQAILNIVTNAKNVLVERKVLQPRIEIICGCEQGENRILVRDNAGGIAEEIIDKIFDPYFTTQFQSKGTGVGLYMSKMIIERHMGGSCLAKNSGEGAEFLVSFPVRKDA